MRIFPAAMQCSAFLTAESIERLCIIRMPTRNTAAQRCPARAGSDVAARDLRGRPAQAAAQRPQRCRCSPGGHRRDSSHRPRRRTDLRPRGAGRVAGGGPVLRRPRARPRREARPADRSAEARRAGSTRPGGSPRDGTGAVGPGGPRMITAIDARRPRSKVEQDRSAASGPLSGGRRAEPGHLLPSALEHRVRTPSAHAADRVRCWCRS